MLCRRPRIFPLKIGRCLWRAPPGPPGSRALPRRRPSFDQVIVKTILYHHHHPEEVVCGSFCLNPSTVAASEIVSGRWWRIESLFPGQCLETPPPAACHRLLDRPPPAAARPSADRSSTSTGIPVSEKKLLRIRRQVGRSALKTPNLGLDCSFFCQVARPRLT